MTTLPTSDVPPGFDELSKEEQIEYVQALWNHIAADEANVPIPDWHLQIVRQRMASFERDETVAWVKVHDRLKQRNDG